MPAKTKRKVPAVARSEGGSVDQSLKEIIAKSSKGKTLTARERKRIEKLAEETKTARTVTELFVLLKIPRTKFYQLRKKKGSPDNLNLDDWRHFVSHDKYMELETEVMSPEKIAFLRGRLLAEKAAREKIERQLKEIRLERELGGFVPFSEAEDAINRVLEPINRLLDSIPKAYSMRVNPTESDFAEEMLREMVRELKRQISLGRGGKISKRKGVK